MTAPSSKFDVLIVDDDKVAADTYAQLVTAETGLNVTTASDPDSSLDIVRAHPLKVVVLDQKMPLASGTELLPRLKEVDARLRAILLTGEAEFEEVGAAVGSFQVFLRKSEILALPGKVLGEYSAYLARVADTGQGSIYSVKRGLPGRRFTVDYSLSLVSVVDPEYIPHDAWQTVIQVNAGEVKGHTESVSFAEGVVVEHEESMNMAATLGLKSSQIQPFDAALRSEISERLGITSDIRNEGTVTRSEEYAIGADEPSVRARAYQQAPIQQRLAIGVIRRCTCCDGAMVSMFRVSRTLPKVATRQVDFLKDGTREAHRTSDLHSP